MKLNKHISKKSLEGLKFTTERKKNKYITQGALEASLGEASSELVDVVDPLLVGLEDLERRRVCSGFKILSASASGEASPPSSLSSSIGSISATPAAWSTLSEPRGRGYH